MKKITGKLVLITGGARGMGKLWAGHFLEDGAEVILWDIDENELNQTKLEFEKTFKKSVSIKKIDVTARQSVYVAVSDIERERGPVDILVNNAGIVSGGEFLLSHDDKNSDIIDVNLKAAMWTMKAVLPAMIKKGGGDIINISSASGFLGVPYMPAYTASKWGLIGLTESVKLEMLELGHKNINFTLLCPSFVGTGMFEGAKAALFTKILNPVSFINKSYKAFKRNKYFVLEPWLVKFIPFLKGILPNWLFNQISKMLGVTKSMKEWKGH